MAREFDWQAIRERLAHMGEAAAASRDPAPEVARAILEARARALAQARAAPQPAALVELVVFRLGDERYALPSRHVLRLVNVGQVTRVPGAPAVLRGIVRHEGEVLPLFDVRTLLGVAPAPEGLRGQILVLGAERPDLGLWVDVAEAVRAVPERALSPPREAGTPEARAWVQGVTTEGLIVLDPDRLLADPRLVISEGPSPT